MALRCLVPVPPNDLGEVSLPRRQHATHHRGDRGRPQPPLLDVRLFWRGPRDSCAAAVADLLGSAGREVSGVSDAESDHCIELDLCGLEPERVLSWALEHLREAEVLGPAWLCEWIGDERLARGFEGRPADALEERR